MKQDLEVEMYRVYVTDMLKGLAGGNQRYFDLINQPPVVEETRTPEEIIAQVNAVFNRNGGEAE